MERNVLARANRLIKATRPRLSADVVCQEFRIGNLLEIGFLSRQCRNDAAGSCIMCDYGCADGVREDTAYIGEMRKRLHNCAGEVRCLLLCTNGSFMDEHQISAHLYRLILQEAASHDIPQIEIETHYQTVTEEKLDTIAQIIPDREIIIEMGLETTNPDYHEFIIAKHVDLRALDAKIQMIQQYGFRVALNIMLGMPFLDASAQLEDARKAISWALERHCKPIIFPMNIKPFTLLFHMYRTGYYTPISYWLLVHLLASIPLNRLDNISIAWYGNREEIYLSSDERTVFPDSCNVCRPKLLDFFNAFHAAVKAKERKALLSELLEHDVCACPHKLAAQLSSPVSVSFEEAYTRYCAFLLEKLLPEEAHI